MNASAPDIPPEFQLCYPLLLEALKGAGRLNVQIASDGATKVDPEELAELHKRLWAARGALRQQLNARKANP